MGLHPIVDQLHLQFQLEANRSQFQSNKCPFSLGRPSNTTLRILSIRGVRVHKERVLYGQNFAKKSEHAALYFTPSGDIQPILSSYSLCCNIRLRRHFLKPWTLDIQLQYKIFFFVNQIFHEIFSLLSLGFVWNYPIHLHVCFGPLDFVVHAWRCSLPRVPGPHNTKLLPPS